MPWVRALLRGQKVYAKADEAGRLVSDGGRVEVRYKPNDGRKYGAREDNLKVVPGELLPDDACGPAEAVEKKKDGEAQVATKSAGTSRAKATTSEERKAAAKAAHDAAPPLAEGQLVAYADGACTGNPGPAGLGVVVVDGDRRIEISEYLGNGTNNIAELTAILRAVGAVEDTGKPLLVRTDSQYAIGVLQKGWKAKANTDLVAEVKDVLKRNKTRLEYVPGHSGVALNERADELAREAVRSRRSSRRAITKSE
ncbi:ribonuclease HI [Polyangium jinanense]|uniref:ribonuclease H n=1 Tax=Polyangium jinanense TaxID=2829994 RepID=A0A9X4ASK6_9BACT|nr:ribonuclease H [Polyangium jinanense]MDC3957209.1 ribonuclease HI [Polyangium jinanense]MDC3982611.1 ribonuclease HI [Polyangium jinanense]